METIIAKFLKFSIVGILGMGIDFGTTYLCKEKLKYNKYFSNAIGFCFAVVSNYLLHRYWTFQSQNTAIGIEFSMFIVVSLIGLSINTSILWILNSKIGIRFYLSKLVAIGITVLWNFLSNYYITFSSQINDL